MLPSLTQMSIGTRPGDSGEDPDSGVEPPGPGIRRVETMRPERQKARDKLRPARVERTHAGGTLRVFMSGQYTPKMHEVLATLKKEHVEAGGGQFDLRVSAPPFNMKRVDDEGEERVEMHEGARRYNVPCFLKGQKLGTYQMMRSAPIATFAAEHMLGQFLPRYNTHSVDFQISKIEGEGRLNKLKDWLRGSGNGGAADVIDGLVAYAKQTRKTYPTDPTTTESLDSLLKQCEEDIGKITKATERGMDWTKMLSYSTAEQGDNLFDLLGVWNKEALYEWAAKSGWRIRELRWLTNLMPPVNLPGSMADIGNLVAAMCDGDFPDRSQANSTQADTSAEQIAWITSVLQDGHVATSRSRLLGRSDIGHLWVPDVVAHDMEHDDCTAWLLASFMRHHLHSMPPPRTIVQSVVWDRSDEAYAAGGAKMISLWRQHAEDLIYDPDAGNAKAVSTLGDAIEDADADSTKRWW